MLFQHRWNRKNRLVFLEQLEMYISSGIPMVRSLLILSERSSGEMKKSLIRAGNAIESGQTMSSVLNLEIGLSQSITGLIACGESSGNLAGTLRAGHALLVREDELIRRCSGAMLYPFVIGLATIGLTVGLVRGIMPQITPLLLSLRTDLPLMTKIVMNASQTLTSYGLYGLIGLICLIALFIGAFRKFFVFRGFVHQCIVHTPVIGSMVLDYNLALFFQSLGASIESGMSLDRAFEKTASSIGLLPLRRKVSTKVAAIGHGELASHLFEGVVPPHLTALIAAGEISGHLGAVFLRVASLIDRDLDHLLRRLTALVEPLMMIGMGILVGSIALSIMMPIYDISRAIQR